MRAHSAVEGLLRRLSPLALGLLRIVAGFLFVQHGLAKLLGWFGGQIVPTLSLFWFAGVLETIGGPLIVLGIFVQPVALILGLEMLAAYWIGHHPQGGWSTKNGGVVPLLFALIFFLLAAVGGGSIALDRDSSSKSRLFSWLAMLKPFALAVVRIGAAFLFFQFGAGKALGWFGGRAARAGTLLWIAGIIETISSPLLVMGLFFRPLSFLCSGEMAAAYWTGHFPRGPGIWPIQNGGEPAVLFCFLYLYLVTAGPGWPSLDGILSKKSTP